ncbi:MAG: glycosyltransferase family 4 protein [Candidatus Nanohaloarchaea archaeon]
MKVVLLSRSFADGEGISEYCKGIAEHLVDNGHEAAIVAFEDGSYYSIDDRVEVYRVPIDFEGNNIYNWSMMMNNELKRKVREIQEEEDFDLIHANDWTTVPGGVALTKHTEKPLVLTIHSTENERGFEGDHAEMISELEWQGAFESDRVFVTKEDTKNSVLFDLDVPGEKLEIVDPYEGGWQQRILDNYRSLVEQEKEVVAD